MEQQLAVSNDIMFFAFRYSMSSSSDTAELVIETIKENVKNINEADLRKYIREVHENRNSGTLIDETLWLDFADYLQEELRSRE